MLRILQRALDDLRHARPPATNPDDDEISFWRERIFNAFLLIGAAVGTIVLLADLVLATQSWPRGLFAGNVLGFAVILALIAQRGRLSFRFRALAVLAINYLLGIGFFFSFGLMSGATLVLFSFPVLAAVLLGLRAAVAALVINGCTAVATLTAIHLGLATLGGPYFLSASRAAVAASTFMLFNVVASLAVAMLVQALQYMAHRERAARESLRDSEAEYRALVQGANSVILKLDESGAIRFANEHAQASFGMPGISLEGRSALGAVFPEDDESREALASLIREGVGPIEGRHRRADGGTAWIVWTRRTIPAKHGKRPEVLCVGNDITERRLLEGQLRQAQKLEAIGTLARGIAHDFNNILAAMMTHTELARMDAQPGSESRETLDEMLRACHRGRDLARQILVFGRKGAKGGEPADLAAIADEALKLLRASLPSTIELRSRLSEALVAVEPSELHQVVMNLAANAGHAMRERGGLLELIVERVELGSARDPAAPHELAAGPYAKLTVRDTGHGMSPQVQERIFDPYFTTKPSGEGTGLGLAVVHGIVRARQGAIVVHSSLGIGTTFEIYLPRAMAVMEAERSTEQVPPRGCEAVLVVDDEVAILKCTSKMLERLGYRVSTAAGGKEALELVRGAPEQFSLVVSDVTMPVMTGDILAQELRQVRADLPVLLCSGYAQALTPARLAEIGVAGLLPKPLTVYELACAMRQALERPAR
ncbi:MAG: response regulator [Deltaproteobacteria bacterium]|nr:response regulator [Deltaproteobacteria bacterium]